MNGGHRDQKEWFRRAKKGLGNSIRPRLSAIGRTSLLFTKENLRKATTDPFEWKILKSNFTGFCLFTLFVYLTLLFGQVYPAKVRFPHQTELWALRITGFVLVLFFVLIVQRIPTNSKWLFPIILTTIVFNFSESLVDIIFADNNLVLTEGSFLLVGILYLFLVGFFSRSQVVTLIFGVGLAAIAFFLFHVFSENLFHVDMSMRELEQYMLEVVFYGIPITTFFIFLNNRVARTLTQKAKESVERLQRIAYFDAETGLPNGIMLEKDIQDFRFDSLTPGLRIVLAGFRLEGLETLNEHKGLEHTTAVVRQLAASFEQALKHCLAQLPSAAAPVPLKIFYRSEGTTFLFPLLIDRAGQDVLPFRTTLEKLLREKIRYFSEGLPLKFNGGFSVYPDDTSNGSQLVKNILHLLHTTKASDLGDFRPFNPETYKNILRKEQLLEAFKIAMETAEVFAVFQPRIRVSDGLLAGFESLSRWDSILFGSVPPMEFIPLLEQHDLILPLTLKVYEQSLRLIERLKHNGLKDFRISINLSPKLLTADFLMQLRDRCEADGVAQHFELEITEGILMILDRPVIEVFRKLRETGLTFSIDDFGTGYSNLGYLQSIEPQVLKIDKKFIDGVPGHGKNAKLVKAIVQIAQSFEMMVVAEGVESGQQLEFLTQVGCDQIQGFFHSKPLTFQEALAFHASEKLR